MKMFLKIFLNILKKFIIKVCFLLNSIRIIYYILAIYFSLNFFFFSKLYPIQIIFLYNWVFYLFLFLFLLFLFLLFLYRNNFYFQIFFFIFIFVSEFFLSYMLATYFEFIPWENNNLSKDIHLFPQIFPYVSEYFNIIDIRILNLPTSLKLEVIHNFIQGSNALPEDKYIEFFILLVIPGLSATDTYVFFDFVSPLVEDLEAIFIFQKDDFEKDYPDFKKVTSESYDLPFEEIVEILIFKYYLLKIFFFFLSWEIFFFGLALSFSIWLIRKIWKLWSKEK